ncbi:MAG: MerR family transcriptional regulator [Deltaproteobacteria bacterium]|jgi:DNA-binding transcriptional MerR regulator|nr:MerR family transcriptional regulator [Deltaproteobacteria bacterium]
MYTIGRLAALAGTKPITVRYYEKTGLMRPPSRLDNGYRSYSERDLDDLIFIRHCRSHGFSLDEIKELLALRDAPEASCGMVDAIVVSHIEKLDGLLKSIRSLRDQLSELRGRCPPGGKVSECGIMRGLMDRSRCPCGESRGHPHEGLPAGAAGLEGSGPSLLPSFEVDGEAAPTSNPPPGQSRSPRSPAAGNGKPKRGH